MRLFPYLTLALALAVSATGCSGKRTNVGGTVTRDGKPLEWKNEGGHLHVLFVPEDRQPNQDPYRAETDRATGTYRISEIKAGWYRVAIYQFDEHHMDALGTKFDPAKSPLRYEVIADGQVIDLDLPKELPQ